MTGSILLSGNWQDYILVFLGGVGVSFSPCVYPLLPVTAGLIAAEAATSRFKGFLLSLIFVTGIAFTYVILGIIASFTGSLFGIISAHPVTNIIAGLIIVLFGLSFLGLFSLPVLNLGKVSSPGKKNGYWGVFLLGLDSGLIIGPCVTPVLGSILTYLAARKNIFYGGSLLLVFAYGLGFTLILAGTFSGFISSLPKSGRWLDMIKKLGGVILLAMGAYFILLA